MAKMRVEFDNGVTWEWEGRMDRERMRWIQWNLFDKRSNAKHCASVYANDDLVIFVEAIPWEDAGREYRDIWMYNVPACTDPQLIRIMEVA